MAFLNPYSARLRDFSSFAFNEQEADSNRGCWKEFFQKRGVRAPRALILEIGCSNAEFLSELAAENADCAFVGLDWKFKVLFKGAQKVDRAKLLNVALLRARAQDLSKIFAESELDEVWIFFPDPWAKPSQLKHRLIRESFLIELHKLLKPGGKIYFKTDHPGYFQWVLSIFGLPIPELADYGMAAETSAKGIQERSYRAKQVLVRKPHASQDELPAVSEAAKRAYRVERHSTRYWDEKSGLPPEGLRAMFATKQTLFEKGFVRDQLPIYYVELTRI
jgi:tRNA (guanine-N7-)-methyltransferase